MRIINNYKKAVIFAVLLILFSSVNLFSENIYFYTKTAFKNAQFWEKQVSDYDANDTWKVYSNFFSGSIGFGMEMVIWDVGVKKGSRLFFKSGIDLDFTGLQFVGGYRDQNENVEFAAKNMYEFDIHGGAFYMGFDWDLFVGGTFPKTDLIWGFGCSWNFLFPVYAPNYDVKTFFEKYIFYAAPSVILGYDIFIPNSNMKVTPQLRVGFTCNPFIPDDLIRDMKVKGGAYYATENYSGAYLEFSTAFSFASVKWKEN